MRTLPGTHLCAAHQGNHSHYAIHNCEICRLTAERDALNQQNEGIKDSLQRIEQGVDVLTAQRDALKDALQALKNTDWTEVMREGALVTWGDASTLGYRVFERIDAAMQGEKE